MFPDVAKCPLGGKFTLEENHWDYYSFSSSLSLLILYTIGYFTHYVWVYLFLMLTHKTQIKIIVPCA